MWNSNAEQDRTHMTIKMPHAHCMLDT